MAEIQKIVTSAGWLDQCPDGNTHMTLLKSILKNYHLHGGMLLFKKNVKQVLAERNQALPATVCKGVGKDPNQK